MYNNIIISSCIFGSVYIFSNSLKLINNNFLKNKKNSFMLIVINGLTITICSSIFIYNSIKAVKMLGNLL